MIKDKEAVHMVKLSADLVFEKHIEANHEFSLNCLLTPSSEYKKLLIDMEAVTHIDNSGVEILIVLLRHLRKLNLDFTLTNISDNCLDMLQQLSHKNLSTTSIHNEY